MIQRVWDHLQIDMIDTYNTASETADAFQAVLESDMLSRSSWGNNLYIHPGFRGTKEYSKESKSITTERRDMATY